MPGYSGGFLNVYLLDDHDIVRQGLRDLLAPARDIRVVGDSGSAATAADMILRLGTHVMVLDLHLQDGSGVHVCREVRAADASVRGLLLTSADDDEALAAALLAGAHGAVVKLARSSGVLTAIRQLGGGESLIDPDARDRVSDALRGRVSDLSPVVSSDATDLLEHVLAGRTDAEIATVTGSAPEDVRADVATLVDALLGPSSPLTAPTSMSSLASQGRHRREA